MSVKKFNIVLTLIVLISSICGTAQAQAIYYVDADAAPNGNGKSWQTAFKHLQDALYNPNLLPGDEILVADGIYNPDQNSFTKDLKKHFKKKGFHISS